LKKRLPALQAGKIASKQVREKKRQGDDAGNEREGWGPHEIRPTENTGTSGIAGVLKTREKKKKGRVTAKLKGEQLPGLFADHPLEKMKPGFFLFGK